MSDVSQGPGWWLASDGKWYAPEQYVQPAPPSQTAADTSLVEKKQKTQWINRVPEDRLYQPPDDDPEDLIRREDGYWLADDGRWYPPTVNPEPITADGHSPPEYSVHSKISGMAIASLVLGLVPVVPFVGSILAIVFGGIARSQIKDAAVRLRGAAMAAWGIALGIVSVVGTVIVIAVLVASAAHSGGSSGWDPATHFGLNQSSYNSDFQLGETDYQLSVFGADNGQAAKSAQQMCSSGTGDTGEFEACEAGFNGAVAANGPVPTQSLYQQGYNEGVADAQQEMQNAAQGGIPNTPDEDCVSGVGPGDIMPTTLTPEEQGCVAGFNATFPNEYGTSSSG